MAPFTVLCGWAVAATFSVLFCPWFAGTPLRAPVAALALLFRLFIHSQRHCLCHGHLVAHLTLCFPTFSVNGQARPQFRS